MNRRTTFLQTRPQNLHAQSLSSQFRYVARQLVTVVQELGVPYAPSGSRVLDYGCATLPYRDLFDDGIDYVAADLAGNPDASVELRDDGTVPLPSESFDLVLSTQVLEHVSHPDMYLAECHRLLKPGGSVALTTHGIMYYHPDPEDFWRWTRDGLTRIVSEAGLEVAEIRGLLGLASAALQLFQDGTLPRVPRVLRRPYIVLMQPLVALADRLHSEEARTHNALVLAVRAVRPT